MNRALVIWTSEEIFSMSNGTISSSKGNLRTSTPILRKHDGILCAAALLFMPSRRIEIPGAVLTFTPDIL